jgi:hypothetical protein
VLEIKRRIQIQQDTPGNCVMQLSLQKTSSSTPVK